MELGLYTFGDLVADPRTGCKPTQQERVRQMIDMAILADEAGGRTLSASANTTAPGS